MGLEQSQGFCPQCNQLRLFSRQVYDVPHVGHLLITIVTFGLWLPIWILHAILNSWSDQPWRCRECGSTPE